MLYLLCCKLHIVVHFMLFVVVDIAYFIVFVFVKVAYVCLFVFFCCRHCILHCFGVCESCICLFSLSCICHVVDLSFKTKYGLRVNTDLRTRNK